MKRIFRFYIESNAWWIDFPEWTEKGGPQEALQMVMGADVMLAWLADGQSQVFLELSETEFPDSRPLHKLPDPCDSGSYYLYPATDLIKDHWRIWLCDVTKYIFNGFPKVIYFKVVENGNSTTRTESGTESTN